MKLKWENVTRGCQNYQLQILGLVFHLGYDLGYEEWVLSQHLHEAIFEPTATFESIEEVEDKVLGVLKKRIPLVEKELKLVKEWLGSSGGIK